MEMGPSQKMTFDAVSRRLCNLEEELKRMNNTNGMIDIKKPCDFNKPLQRFMNSPWCYASSRIMTTERIFFRLMWLIAFIIASVGCFYSIQSIIFDYLRYDTVSQSNVVFKEEMEFPQVLLCSYTDEVDVLYESLYYCYFNNKDISDKIGFKSIFYDNTESKCLQLDLSNSTRMKQKKFGTYFSGLDVALNSSLFVKEFELAVYILDNFAMPKGYMPDIFLERNTWNLVYLDWTNEKRLSYPYSDCIDDFSELEKTSDLIARTIKYNSFYQKSRCYQLCKFKFYAETYNCTYPGLYETDYTVDCNDDGHEEKFDNGSFFKENVCDNLCPIECETNTFKLTQDKSSLFLGDHPWDIEFYLTFRDQQMTKIHQRPKTRGSDLISKLGGTLGLFIGIKILSFFDIVEFLLEISYRSVRMDSSNV